MIDRARILSFAGRYTQVARDGLRGRGVHVAWVTALNGVSATTSGVIIALLASVVHGAQQEAGVTIPVLDITFQGMTLVWIASVGVFLLLIVSAYAAYESKVRARAIARAYHVRSVLRALEVLRQLPRDASGGNSLETPIERQMLVRFPLHLGRSVQTMVEMIYPASFVVVGLGMAMYLDATKTVVGFALFTLLLPMVYRRSDELNENSRAYFKGALQEYVGAVSGIAERIDAANLDVCASQAVRSQFEHSEQVNEYLDRFDGIQLAGPKMVLTTTLFMALLVGLGFLAAGHMVIVEGRSWGEVAAFVGAFLLVLRSLQTIGAMLASLHAFYPQAADYLETLARLRESIAKGPPCGKLPDVLSIQHEGGIAEVRNDAVIGLVGDVKLSHRNLKQLLAPVLRAAGIAPGSIAVSLASSPQTAVADSSLPPQWDVGAAPMLLMDAGLLSDDREVLLQRHPDRLRIVVSQNPPAWSWGLASLWIGVVDGELVHVGDAATVSRAVHEACVARAAADDDGREADTEAMLV